jgi:hypothetical protein
MTALIVTPRNRLPLHPDYVRIAGPQLNNGDRRIPRPEGSLWYREEDRATRALGTEIAPS